MKQRHGFVSNSSSSSFIVINDSEFEPPALPADFIVGERGQTQFGWEQQTYADFDSKLNFAYIQAQAAQTDGNNDWIAMLEDVLCECGVDKEQMTIILCDDWDSNSGVWAYIDHQSAYCENENCEMFESKQALQNFLFNPLSYIQGDNDNH